MKEGKLSNALLENTVLKSIRHHRKETIIGPGVGEDCGAMAFGEYACVITTDPITGATKDIGKLAVHVSCNDIASAGVEPIGITMTLLAPVGTTAEEIETVMKQAQETAESLHVDIVGGHTEITSAVNRMVVSVTAIGKGLQTQIVSTSGGCKGDVILMTKKAAIEGTSIVAAEKEDYLLSQGMSAENIQKAKAFGEMLSVVPEGLIAGKMEVSAMHDATEGGILGAVWELAEACQCGCVIELASIPVDPLTESICQQMQLDLYRLISSGSMIITCKPEQAEELINTFRRNDIECSRIGHLVESGFTLINKDGIESVLEPPGADELYKIFTSDLQCE